MTAETLDPEQRKALEVLMKGKKVEEKKPEPPKSPKVKGIRNAEFEVITIKDGFNVHETKKEPLANKSYEKERFLIPRNLGDKLRSRIRFLVVLKSSLIEGVSPIPVCLSDPVKINSKLLYTVKTSNTLRSALSSLFKKQFSFGFGGKKTLFIIVIVAVVGAIVYLVYTGQLNLGSFIKF